MRMSSSGRFLFYLVSFFMAAALPSRADELPGLVPETLVSPLGAFGVDFPARYFDGAHHHLGLRKRLELDPSIPSLTGVERSFPADWNINRTLLHATANRVLVSTYVSYMVEKMEVRGVEDFGLIHELSLQDGWSFFNLGAQHEGSTDQTVARVVFRPAPSDASRREVGCALIDLETGSVRVISFGLVPLGVFPTNIISLKMNSGKITGLFNNGDNTREIRVYDRTSGNLLVKSSTGIEARLHAMSDNLLCARSSWGLYVARPDLNAYGLLPMGATPLDDVTAVIRGNIVWACARDVTSGIAHFWRFDVSNLLHPRLLDELAIPDPTYNAIFYAGFGKDWLAIFNPAGSADFYDLSPGALNHQPIVRISPASAREQDRRVTVTLTLDKPSGLATSVRLFTENSTAKSGEDYLAVDRRVNFPAGATTATVDITLVEDDRLEQHESLSLRIADPEGLRPAGGAVPAVILGNGMGRWQRFFDAPLTYADSQLVGPTVGEVLAVTDTRLAAIIASGTPNAGKLGIYDLNTLKLLKILDLPGNGGTVRTVSLEGSKLRTIQPLWTDSVCCQVDLESGTLEASGTLPLGPYNPFGRDVFLWQDSRHLIFPEGKKWNVHNLSVPASTVAMDLAPDVLTTYALAADNRYIAALLEISDPGSLSVTHTVVEIRDRGTLALVKRIACPGFAAGSLYSVLPAVALSPQAVVVSVSGDTRAYELGSGELRWKVAGPVRTQTFASSYVQCGNDYVLVQGGEEYDTGFQIRDLGNGALVDSFWPEPSGLLRHVLRLDRSAGGFAGTDGRKAYRLLEAPEDPSFAPVSVSGVENLPLTAELVPNERFATARPLIFNEVRRGYPGNYLPYEFTALPGAVTAAAANAKTSVSFTPLNDRRIRTDNRTADMVFATAARPFGVLARVQSTVVEDDVSLTPLPFAVNPAPVYERPNRRMAVSDQWLVSNDTVVISVYSATTGAFLRSFASPESPSGDEMIVSGNLLFYSATGATMPQGTQAPVRVGAVFVFDLTNGQQIAKLANNNKQEIFGISLAANDRWLAVGGLSYSATSGLVSPTGGTVSIFDLTTMKRVQLKQSALLGFGESVAVYGDRVYVGAPGAAVLPQGGSALPTAGGVKGFALPGGSALPDILAPIPCAGGSFGQALVIAGNRLAVLQPGWSVAGSNDTGSLHVYNLPDQSLYLTIDPPAAGRPFDGPFSLNQSIQMNGRVISFGIHPMTFVDLATKKFLGSWTLKAPGDGGNFSAEPFAINGTHLYWGNRNIVRQPLPVLPTVVEPPGPPLYPVLFTDWRSSLTWGSIPMDARIPNADPDGDGFTNWQEMLLMSNPTGRGSSTPMQRVIDGWLIMKYRRVDSALGWPIHPEFSTDMKTWSRQIPGWCQSYHLGTSGGMETIELNIDTHAGKSGWLRFSFKE